MNRSCLTALLCSLPTIGVAADVVIRRKRANLRTFSLLMQ